MERQRTTKSNTNTTELCHCLWVYGCWALDTPLWGRGGEQKRKSAVANCWSNKLDKGCVSSDSTRPAVHGGSDSSYKTLRKVACINSGAYRASNNWAGTWICTVHISILWVLFKNIPWKNKHQRKLACVHREREREHQANVQPPPEREGICNNYRCNNKQAQLKSVTLVSITHSNTHTHTHTQTQSHTKTMHNCQFQTNGEHVNLGAQHVWWWHHLVEKRSNDNKEKTNSSRWLKALLIISRIFLTVCSPLTTSVGIKFLGFSTCAKYSTTDSSWLKQQWTSGFNLFGLSLIWKWVWYLKSDETKLFTYNWVSWHRVEWVRISSRNKTATSIPPQ